MITRGKVFIPLLWYIVFMINHAYTAGLIDGEGYVSVIPSYHKNNRVYYVPCIKVASVTKCLVDYLHDNYGGHITYRVHKRANQRPSYSWELKNMDNVSSFIDKIYDFLLVKKRQSELVKECCSLTRYNNPKSEKYDPLVFKRKEEIHKELLVLNHRGTSPAETERKSPYSGERVKLQSDHTGTKTV